MIAETTDFLIITALREELRELLNYLPEHAKVDPAVDDITTYYSAKLSASFPSGDSAKYNIIACCLLSMGRTEAAAVTSLAVQKWNPRFVLLVGIAGGISDAGVSLGDILISDQIVDYELQKQERSYDSIRYSVHRTDPRLLGAAMNFDDPSGSESLEERRPEEGTPRLHIGPIATGDKVVAHKKLIDRYRQDWPKLIGVEMEAGGVATAVYHMSSRPGFFMIRGVSDLADEDKDLPTVTKWRNYACSIAAAYTISLLKSGPVPKTEQSIQADENLDRVVKHTLSIDRPSDVIQEKIEKELGSVIPEGIFGPGGTCFGYPLRPRQESCFLAKEGMDRSDDLSAALSLALDEFKVSPIGADDLVIPGSFLCKIAALIRETRFGIYELTDSKNLNVYLQLGIAIGLRRPFLLLKHRDIELSPLASGLDYFPVESYLELRFDLKPKVRDIIVSMSHYLPDVEESSKVQRGVLVGCDGTEFPDFAYAITKVLHSRGFTPLFGQIDSRISTILDREDLTYNVIDKTAGNLLNRLSAAIATSDLIIVRIDGQASPDAILILGIALAQNRRTILIHSEKSPVPSYLLGLNHIRFSTFLELSQKIDNAVSKL